MINFSFLLKLFLLSMLSLTAMGQTADKKKETTEAEDIAAEFKETKFLQIDKLDVPRELTRIEDQIRQNALDVIISTKTHTPVYAQKREEGYSDSYKKFHGLTIQIVPIPNEQDFYSLSFHYYNWTTRKFDKRLRKRISKYNVLNELRFGLYELMLGKKFVDEHKDEIEKQNYDRILAVRENEESQKKIERKKKKQDQKKKEDDEIKLLLKQDEEKKKLIRDAEEKKEKRTREEIEEQLAVASTKTNVPEVDIDTVDVETEDPEEVEKTKDKSSPAKARKKTIKKPPVKPTPETPETSALPVEPPAPDVGETIPSVASLFAFGSVFDEVVTSKGLLATTTRLRYLGFGARYIQEQETERPRGYQFTIKAGLPIKTDDYEFPVYRSIEAEIYKRKLLRYFKVLAGLNYSPIYFVNLANAGEGLSVFENDVVWMKAGLSFSTEFSGKNIDIRAIFMKSLIVTSNQKKKMDGNGLNLNLQYMHNSKHGIEVVYQKSEFVGELAASSTSVMVSYVYKFEN